MSWTSWNRKLWFLPDSLLWFLALKFHVCLARKLVVTVTNISESIHSGPLDWGSKSNAAESLLILVHFEWNRDFISCLQLKSQFTSKHTFTERNHLCIWHEIFQFVVGHWWQRAERNVLRGESVLYVQLYVKYVNFATNERWAQKPVPTMHLLGELPLFIKALFV